MTELLEKLNSTLDTESAKVRMWEQRYDGDLPLSYLSPEAVKALGNRLKTLKLNYCRLAVDAIAERLRIDGFTVNGESDSALWSAWVDNGMVEQSRQAIIDALAVGRGFISVWSTDGVVSVTAEAPDQCVIKRNPITGQAIAGLKRWVEDNHAYCVLYTLDTITLYESKSGVPTGGAIPPTGWTALESTPNVLGALPLVQITNRGRTRDSSGRSEMDSIADLNDALTKLTVDAMVTSEYYCRPRRWATGIEIHEDEEGNPIDPFANSDRTWISEGVDSKFGQFPTADMSSYAEMTQNMLGQISALSGLPAHYVMVSQQPGSGEEVKARETSLVARCESKHPGMGRDLAQVAALMVAVMTNKPVQNIKVATVWHDPATRTLAAEADAMVKLYSAGVLPIAEVLATLGYGPEQSETIQSALQSAEARKAILSTPSPLALPAVPGSPQ